MLGQVVLDKLPPARRGEVPIEVEFDIGHDGTLSIAARDLTSGQSQKLKLEAKGLLAPGEAKRLAQREEEYMAAARTIEIDAKTLRHAEMIAEAEGMLPAVRKATADVPGADAAVTAAELVIRDARKIHETLDPEGVANSMRELDRVIQSFNEVVKLSQSS